MAPLYRWQPLPLGLVVVLVQIALGLVLFAVFQQYVPNRLDAGDAWGGYLLSAYGLARFASETPTGAIADRIERKLALLIGLAVMLPALAVMSAASEPLVFLGCAALMGIGTAFQWPATYALSADLYPPQRRGSVVGFLNLCQLAGFGIGALAGVFLVEHAVTALFLMALGVVFGAAAGALAGIPSVRGRRSSHDVPPPLTRPPLREVWSWRIAVLALLVMVTTATVAMIVPAIRPYGEQQLDASFATVTIALIPGVVLAAAAYVPAGLAADRWGRTRPLFLGQALVMAGMLIVAETDVLPIAALGGAVIFAGNVFTVPAMNAAVMDLAPPSHRGTLIGFSVALSGLGLALGPALGGAITGSLGPAGVFRMGALFAALTAAGVLAYSRRAPAPAYREAQAAD
jgi:MFS family permease